MNVVRRHLSRIKGGGLLDAAGAARVVTLIASDVVRGAPHDIGSGPSVPDPTTCADARKAYARFVGGEPAADMGVMALQSRYERGVRQWVRAGSAIVNDLGEFRIPSLAAGSYLVAAVNAQSVVSTGVSAQQAGDKPEREYVLTFFPSATDSANATPIPVAAGALYCVHLLFGGIEPGSSYPWFGIGVPLNRSAILRGAEILNCVKT